MDEQRDMDEVRIVREDLSRCLGALCMPKERFYVIKEPISYGGFCKGPFLSREEAEQYKKQLAQAQQ